MIRYRLVCSHDHAFDQWFDSMGDYDAQKLAGTLVCPECGDTSVGKSLMAPGLAGSGGTVGRTADPVPPCGGGGCGGGACPVLN